MNFSIDRTVLLENLNLISRGLPVKTAMPVLNGIKMELTQEDLFLTSSNTDISVQVVINDPSLEIRETGKIIVPGNFFIQIIRKINSKKVDISLIEDKIMVIKAERSEFKLNLLSVYDYPNIDFVCLDKPLKLSSKNLRSIIRETAYATASNEKRPILTGVSLKLHSNQLIAVATDSFRLSQKKIELEGIDYDDFNIDIDDYDHESPREKAANQFAANALISDADWKTVPKVHLSPMIIQRTCSSWAESKGYNKWIALGRLSYQTGMYKFKTDATRCIS